MNLGKFINETLQRQGRRKTWLCDQMKMNYKTLYNRIEFDRLKASDLLVMADLLGIDLNELKLKYKEMR